MWIFHYLEYDFWNYCDVETDEWMWNTLEPHYNTESTGSGEAKPVPRHKTKFLL